MNLIVTHPTPTPEKPLDPILRYVGSKKKLSKVIREKLHSLGGDCLVDVFGGSGIITMTAGFAKRVYNDINGDLVNFFRVMASPSQRHELIDRLKWLPPSRELFLADYNIYLQGGFSFKNIQCPIDRAVKTFYRMSFVFGGKITTGGFAVSQSDRKHIKQVFRYNKVIDKLDGYGEFWRQTCIESLDFKKLILIFQPQKKVMFFIDPPYVGFNQYYVGNFSENDHRVLAYLLNQPGAPSVCTFYDCELVRELYPESKWDYLEFAANKNNNGRRQQCRRSATELVLTRKI